MMKKILPILLLAVPVCCWHCGQNPAPAATTTTVPEPVAIANVQRITHEEASDTLRVDSTAALKLLVYKKLDASAAQAVLAANDLPGMIVSESPDNGFYGDNHYRIEFIIFEMTPVAGKPMRYLLKGKNRFKKVISAFEGVLEIKSVAEFTDPNLKANDLEEEFNFGKAYSLQGNFLFKEDSTKNSSGRFAGDFTMEFYTPSPAKTKEEGAEERSQLWFFSDNSPSQGSGYRFTGNWTSYKNPGTQKPFIWSRDIFRFANGILDNFYYGERDVTINPKYRNLGWDSYWEGEEWWNDSPQAKEAK